MMTWFLPLLQNINIGSQINLISFHLMFYETSCALYIPETLARGYKTHKFHNTPYGMKIHLRFFLLHELTRHKQVTIHEIDFFCKSERIMPWMLLGFGNKSTCCSVIAVQSRAHFIVVKSKTSRRACFDIIMKANSPFNSLRTFTNTKWYFANTEESYFACADSYETCCHKI